ncbi:MAG: hypothetical protein LBS03_02290 [Bacteroidales bacterium]|jgi:hypothetical protein|nr:hypothetical protein [Bacteroidales bacterium]
MKTLAETFTTILTFTYPYETAVVRGRLASDGIRCFMCGELTKSAYPCRIPIKAAAFDGGQDWPHYPTLSNI